MVPPFFSWDDVFRHRGAVPLELHQTLCIFDSCTAGLASLNSEVELLGASAWHVSASALTNLSYTRFLIDAIKAQEGAPITASQLTSHMTYKDQRILETAQPILRRAYNKHEASALFHRIGEEIQAPTTTPTDSERAKVSIIATIANVERPLNVNAWSRWLSSDLPLNIASIEVQTAWPSSSMSLLVVLPQELWFYLPSHPAYIYVGPVKGGFLSNEAVLAPRPSGTENIPFAARRPVAGAGSLPSKSTATGLHERSL